MRIQPGGLRVPDRDIELGLMIARTRHLQPAIKWSVRFTLHGTRLIPRKLRRVPLSLCMMLMRWYHITGP